MQDVTPRERFKKTFMREESDKVPLDLGGHQTGIHLQAYKRLLAYLNIEENDIYLYDILQQLAVPCEKLLERFQIDTRTIYPPKTLISAESNIDTSTFGEYIGWWDSFGVFWGRKPQNPDVRLLYNDIVNPFAKFTSSQEIRNFDWPKVETNLFNGVEDYAKKLYDKTDYALIGRSVGSIFQWSHYLFGLQNFLKLSLREPEMIEYAFEGLFNYCKDYATQYLSRVGKYIESIQFTSDLTHQTGPIISPRLYKKLVKPFQQRLIRHIRSIIPDIKINFHTCGAASYFIDDLHEIGVNSINPVQINAEKMEPDYLKKNYGEKMCFWGGLCNSQKTLPFGTQEDIKKEVQYNTSILKKGGGYIGSGIHNITYDVPPQNIVAMFDSAIENSNYN